VPSETISLMVEGGKATPGPAVAQKLGPMGMNMKEVMDRINEKTESFKGMQVPVKLKIDTKTKEYDIEVGTPPTSQLIKKELGLEKGSGQPDKEKVANISIEQCIKVAKMKKDAMFTTDLKKAVKSVVGSCNALGIIVEGKLAVETEKDIVAGKYDQEIKEEKTEITEEKKKQLETQLKKLQEKLAKKAAKLKAEAEAEKAEEKPAEEKKEEGKEEGKEGEKKEEGKEGEKKEEGKAEEKKEAKK